MSPEKFQPLLEEKNRPSYMKYVLVYQKRGICEPCFSLGVIRPAKVQQHRNSCEAANISPIKN